MGDELRDRIARALHARDPGWRHYTWDVELNDLGRQPFLDLADAVLAVLPQYDQVGWQSGSGLFYTDDDRRRNPHVRVVPVYIVRDTTEEEQG